MGPTTSRRADVYLRTAVGVDAEGWAHFGHVKMPDYRWGIFLASREKGRKIGFGDHLGEPPGSRCRASTATGCAASS
jgi:benzoyl-CoA 2,3-dioxygenase component B